MWEIKSKEKSWLERQARFETVGKPSGISLKAGRLERRGAFSCPCIGQCAGRETDWTRAPSTDAAHALTLKILGFRFYNMATGSHVHNGHLRPESCAGNSLCPRRMDRALLLHSSEILCPRIVTKVTASIRNSPSILKPRCADPLLPEIVDNFLDDLRRNLALAVCARNTRLW